MPEGTHPGIPDPFAIDLIGKRRDGGVDLAIVVSQQLDGSEQSQRALLAKIDNYLDFRASPDFHDEFGVLSADHVCIVVHFKSPPDDLILRLLDERCVDWVAQGNATLRYETTAGGG